MTGFRLGGEVGLIRAVVWWWKLEEGDCWERLGLSRFLEKVWDWVTLVPLGREVKGCSGELLRCHLLEFRADEEEAIMLD
jgi:hypothetical protein